MSTHGRTRTSRTRRCVATFVLAGLAVSTMGAVPSGQAPGGGGRHATSTATTEPTTTSDASVTVPAPARDAVRVQLRIGTSSDWTVAELWPGEVLAARVVSSSNAQVSRAGGAWSVRPVTAGQQAWATVEAVLHEPDGHDLVVSTRKGWAGRTAVALVDVQRGVTLLERLNDVHSTTDTQNTARWTLPRGEVFVEPIELPRATAEPKVLAFYYPWFSDYDDVTLTDRPSDPRSTFSSPDVLDMTEQAASAGIDGFVVSWAGEDHDGWGFDRALAAGEATGQAVTGYLEVGAAPLLNRQGVVTDWLRQLLDRAGSSAFLRHDGVPVVFVYGMEQLSPAAWELVHAQLAVTGHEVRLVGDVGRPEYAAAAWGEHRYSALGSIEDRERLARERALRLRSTALIGGTAPMAWVATVAPGYDDHLVRLGNPVIDREDGQRYDDTWEAALASQPDWVVITSWNEWYEGTSVEPSVRFGDLALRQTADWSAAWTGTGTTAAPAADPSSTRPKGPRPS